MGSEPSVHLSVRLGLLVMNYSKLYGEKQMPGWHYWSNCFKLTFMGNGLCNGKQLFPSELTCHWRVYFLLHVLASHILSCWECIGFINILWEVMVTLGINLFQKHPPWDWICVKNSRSIARKERVLRTAMLFPHVATSSKCPRKAALSKLGSDLWGSQLAPALGARHWQDFSCDAVMVLFSRSLGVD